MKFRFSKIRRIFLKQQIYIEHFATDWFCVWIVYMEFAKQIITPNWLLVLQNWL